MTDAPPLPPPPEAGSPLGRPLRRREDRRLLTGEGRFTEDIASPPGCLHAVFLRSPHAHAGIGAIDAAAARALPGVAAVLTGRDLAALVAPLRMAPPIEGLQPMEMPVLPVEAARFVGDPVALVLAETRVAAEDAAELVGIAWDPLPAIASVADAAAPEAALVDPALPSNRVSLQTFATPGLEAAFARADRVVQARFGQQRQTHAPMEPRSALALWDNGRQHLTMQVGTQAPHPYRSALAVRLGLKEWQVTVESPEMGGGFGQKIIPLREDLCIAAAARLLRRPVRWRETRGENLTAVLHAREEVVTTRAAVAADGRILGLTCAIDADFGAWSFFPANYMARVVAMILPGPYRIRDYGYEVSVWLTNKCPSGPMRAPMAITSWVMEGTMDAIARALGLDPLEVRRCNSLTEADLPWITATGERYDAVTPLATLEAVAEQLGYAALRAEQAARGPAAETLLGIGLCTVVESNTYSSAFYRAAGIPGSGHEVASLRIEPSGAVIASCGLMGSGQGYDTTLAQAAAAGLGAAVEEVQVQIGNSDTAPYGMGSRGARGATAGGGALYLAGLKLKAKLLAIAAAMLDLNSADALELRDGVVLRRLAEGWAETGLTLAQLARTAHLDPLRLPPGLEPGLHQILAYDPPGTTYTNSTHACAVEVERATGTVRILRYMAAEDCGTRINPMVVAGQTHGATAMGLSGALLEHAAYGTDGQALAGSFMDYAIARADDLPAFELSHHDTPNPRTPAGIKGMSEGGTMGGIGALMNAVNDALAQVGARLEAQPATPARVWAALRGAADPTRA
ncbi:xanthine dehydrogenase family protein molybdopterin-binding subunit [Paracraurococcus lichenis]|uniref:Molybdopterin-dependent oxidoreductase n=1 Tax=Paracraurococcus lichenis TaxID=3064888 RepID=A0ABT9E616_9PROT|nr:molybdopterin cofactor-binding domain-containing protein [Paracraurococcus sp. LOR1-02]MDO9711613.1 molybdopterin-dependent oxidoreductase [Paracraurococcus sp. LOR1-02]